jgi:hypothetical protein
MHKISIDFVAGSHGNFLEAVLNKHFGIVDAGDVFTALGTSHQKNKSYHHSKLFSAKHWFELYPTEYMKQFDKIISIVFQQDDLLLLSSVSLLRAGDMNIDNNELEFNTRTKLNNKFYGNLLQQIDAAYPFLDSKEPSIPRDVLREFFKFGFRDPNTNGYWIKQQEMKYPDNAKVFQFDFASFHDLQSFVSQIKKLETFLNMNFEFDQEFYRSHEKFLSFIPYLDHKKICDHIIHCVENSIDIDIPKLTLFQESYINGNLETIFQKEMPFRSVDYFNTTSDMLYYIKNQAPEL